MTQLDLIPPPAPPKPFQIGTDRPILFSGPMIRALLDGRKTRRLLKLAGLWNRLHRRHAHPFDYRYYR